MNKNLDLHHHLQMNPTAPISSYTIEDNVITFLDPSSRKIIEIREENGKLIYSIQKGNSFLRISSHQVPPLLRQFTNLFQLSAFLQNGNIIKAKKRGDQEFHLEVLLPCQGGVVPWASALIWLATTGIVMAADHWIVRPYLIKPLLEKVEKSNLSKTAKTIACYAIEAADFALMALFGGALEAGVKSQAAKITSKKVAEKMAGEFMAKIANALKNFEKTIIEKVFGEVMKETGKGVAKEAVFKGAAATVAEGLRFFKLLAMGAKDTLIFNDSIIKASVRHGMKESAIKKAMTSFYYRLGGAVPRIAMSLHAAKTLRNALESCQTLAEQQALVRSVQAQQEIIRDLERGEAVPISGQGVVGSEEESQKLQIQKKAREDEKIKTAKRIYLKHIQQKKDIDNELRSKIQDATDLSDRSIEQLIQALEKKYPPGAEINSDISSQLSDVSDLSWLSANSQNVFAIGGDYGDFGDVFNVLGLNFDFSQFLEEDEPEIKRYSEYEIKSSYFSSKPAN